MLEGLDAIQWSRLTHAYGDAGDIPGCLRALASDDEDDRVDAEERLWQRFGDAGPVDATAPAVPFLLELAAGPAVADRTEILGLLAWIAEGQQRLGEDPGTRTDRQHAWAAEARQAAESGVGVFLGLLDDEDPEVRVAAARALGRSRGLATRLIPELSARVARHPDHLARAALILAVQSLEAGEGGPGSRPANPVFAERMRPGEHPVVRFSAAIGLSRSSPGGPSAEVVDTLCTTAGAAWSDFEQSIGNVLYQVAPLIQGDPDAWLRFVSGMLDSEDPRVRGGTRDTAARLCHERRAATPVVVAMLGERLAAEDLAGRRQIAGILSHLGAAAAGAAGPLAVALDDDDTKVRASAAVALAGLGDPRALPVLIDWLESYRGPVIPAREAFQDRRELRAFVGRWEADEDFPEIAEALGRFGDGARAAVPVLLDLLRQPAGVSIQGQQRRGTIARLLGRIGPEAQSAIPDLIDLMKESPEERSAAIWAIGDLGGPEARAAIPVMIALMKEDPEPAWAAAFARQAAAEVIPRLGGPEARAAVPVLETWLRSPSDRLGAAGALWRIDGRAGAVLPVLIEGLRPGGQGRSAAAAVLGEIGAAAREAVPALVACLEDDSFHANWVHFEAAIALWRIEGRADRTLPVLAGLLRDPAAIPSTLATKAAEAAGEMGAEARALIPILRAAAATDVRPFRFDPTHPDNVIEDDAFLAAIAGAIRRIEGDPGRSGR